METFNPHPNQLEVIKSNARFRLVNCGRRWGKTTLAVNEMCAFASLKPKSLVVYFAPTFSQARDIAWRMLKATAPQYGKVHSVNETRLEIKLNDSEIWLRGVENYESARGLGIDFLVVDELAMMSHWYSIWEEVLRATLADTKGQALFCSTPKGYNHWFTLWEKGQKGEDDYFSWTFPSSTNPFLSGEEIEKARAELSQEAFEQEWEAEFRSTVGLAHTQFDRNIHLIESFDVPADWSWARGFDFGSSHPTASIRVAIDFDGNWFADAYYKEAGKTIQEHANAVMAQDYAKGMVPIWGDPSGAQWITEFSQYGLHIQPANKEVGTNARNWVESCIESVNQRLRPIQGHVVMLPNGKKFENAPTLFFLKNPGYEKCMYEIENLKWKETNAGEVLPSLDEGIDKHGHFDLMASLRYLSASYQKPSYFDTTEIPDESIDLGSLKDPGF